MGNYGNKIEFPVFNDVDIERYKITQKLLSLYKDGGEISCYTSLLPNKLYKYKKIAGDTIDLIVKNEIYYSNPSNFNDVVDCSIFPYIANEYLKSKDKDNNFNVPFTKFEKMRHEAVHEVGNIACLSESNTNYLLWSHYADNHKGICIEYDVQELIQNEGYYCFTRTLFPVIYTNHIESSFKFLFTDIKFINDNYNFGIKRENYHSLLLMLLKSKYWEYEKEWRMILKTGNKGDCPISGIYFGLKTPKKDIEKIQKDLQINAYKMEIDNINTFGNDVTLKSVALCKY